MKNFTTYLFVCLFVCLLSCNDDSQIYSTTQNDEQAINEKAKLEEGIIKVDSKFSFDLLYDEIKKTGSENFYNDNIKQFEKYEFKSLRPYFKNDTEFEEYFKKNKTKIKSKTSKKTDSEDSFDLDDEVIIDSNFAVLLNEDREIIVKGKLYKYQENGVYIVDEDKIKDFRSFIENQEKGLHSKSYNDFEFHEMDYLSEERFYPYVEDNNSNFGGGGGGSSSMPNEPDFFEAKHKFSTSEFSKNPSLWGQVFGYARKEYVYLIDDKRMKLKYWNRNYLLFKSLGVEVRFQKKVKFLGITGWQKSYPDKIALGINSAQFNYDLKASQYLNPSVFNKKIYKYNGKSYFPNGVEAGYQIPKVDFPLAKLLGGTNALNVYITNPFSEFDFEINMTAEQYAKVINSASSQLLKLAAKEVPALFGIKPSTTSTILSTEFYKDITSITLSNLNWVKEVDNNITQYFDFTVPTITVKADIAFPGESFFSNPSVPFPTLSFNNYKTGLIDFYSGVLYKNKWYGLRMVSTNFDR